MAKIVDGLEDDLEDDPIVEERLHPILSNKEVLDAKKAALAKVEAERKKAAMAEVTKAETERLRLEEGLVTGSGVKDEMVKVTLDLAEHSSHISINGLTYHHGFTYTVPRHVAETLREIQARGHLHQDQVDGKSLAQHYLRQKNSSVSGAGL